MNKFDKIFTSLMEAVGDDVMFNSFPLDATNTLDLKSTMLERMQSKLPDNLKKLTLLDTEYKNDGISICVEETSKSISGEADNEYLTVQLSYIKSNINFKEFNRLRVMLDYSLKDLSLIDIRVYTNDPENNLKEHLSQQSIDTLNQLSKYIIQTIYKPRSNQS